MTSQTIEQMLETRYIKPNVDDWFDMILGALFWGIIFGATGLLIIRTIGISKDFDRIYLIFFVGFIIYLYWRDGQIKIVNTGLTKYENLNVLRGVFKQMNWTGEETSDMFLINDDNYVTKFVRVRIFYSDNVIGYNFQYTSPHAKIGRPFFFLGIRKFLKIKFLVKLDELIEDEKEIKKLRTT